MKKFKHYLAITLGSLLVIFVIQNLAAIEINFLFWSFQTRRFLIIAFSLLTGVLIGMIIGARNKPDKGQNKDED